jgi:hypothetical protein
MKLPPINSWTKYTLKNPTEATGKLGVVLNSRLSYIRVNMAYVKKYCMTETINSTVQNPSSHIDNYQLVKKFLAFYGTRMFITILKNPLEPIVHQFTS